MLVAVTEAAKGLHERYTRMRFFGFDFEFCTVSLPVMLKYKDFVKKKFFDWATMGEVGSFRVVLRLRRIKMVLNLGPFF